MRGRILHCHMTHHVMNQMFFGFTNTIGMGSKDVEPEVQELLPDYMTMARPVLTTGPASRSSRSRPTDPNEEGRWTYNQITIGGMASVLKVRPRSATRCSPGTPTPAGTSHPLDRLALARHARELRRDGINV